MEEPIKIPLVVKLSFVSSDIKCDSSGSLNGLLRELSKGGIQWKTQMKDKVTHYTILPTLGCVHTDISQQRLSKLFKLINKIEVHFV